MDPWFLVAVLALAGLAVTAYALRALDFWGSIASFLLGLEVAVLGGLGWMFLMVLFTGMGFVATLVGYRRKKRLRVAEARGGERGISNVLGNGLAAGLVVATAPVLGVQAVAVAFTAAMAAVAADTMASEIGVLARRTRSILPPFATVRLGANGGVSLLGQGAALGGAAAIAAAAVPLVGITWPWALVAAGAGFLGCQLDSILGATVEAAPGKRGIGKQTVNFVASVVPALLLLLFLSVVPALVLWQAS